MIAHALAHGSFAGSPTDRRNARRSKPVMFGRGGAIERLIWSIFKTPTPGQVNTYSGCNVQRERNPRLYTRSRGGE